MRRVVDPELVAQEFKKLILAGRADIIMYYYDRLDGRPRQQLDITGDEADPRTVALRQLAEEMRLARLADSANISSVDADVKYLDAGGSREAEPTVEDSS